MESLGQHVSIFWIRRHYRIRQIVRGPHICLEQPRSIRGTTVGVLPVKANSTDQRHSHQTVHSQECRKHVQQQPSA